uniref:Uncharacterized protein n=1 Tax=Cannabis sativa TaxID=3483 RepID=A0A803PI52_CANSA
MSPIIVATFFSESPFEEVAHENPASMFMDAISPKFRELQGPVVVETRGSESTIYVQGSYINVVVLFNNDVKELDHEIELRAWERNNVDIGVEVNEEAKSLSDEDVPLEKPISHEDLLSKTRKPDLVTFKKLQLILTGCMKLFTNQRPYCPFTNHEIINTDVVVVSIRSSSA